MVARLPTAAAIAGQHRADDAGGRDDHRVVGTGQRLRKGEDERVAARQTIARSDIHRRIGDGRHLILQIVQTRQETRVLTGLRGFGYCIGCRSEVQRARMPDHH